MPVNFMTEYPFKDAIGCDAPLRTSRAVPSDGVCGEGPSQEYYAIITHMDAQIGRILDALRARGKAGNTVIFFTGDNGLAVGHHGLMGKQNMFEHSVRVPLIARGPGLAENQRIRCPVYLQDIMPTTLELAGWRDRGMCG